MLLQFPQNEIIFKANLLTVTRKEEKIPLRFIYPNLVSEMQKRGLDYQDLAEILGISKHAAYRRLRGHAGWKLHETIRLCQYFKITDMAWLFYCDDTISQNF